jgi:hypothetical protein
LQLLDGYSIEEVGGEARVLKRPNGYMLAAFGRGVKFENIQRVAEADHRYLRAKKLDSMFGVGGDPESAYMFSEDVRTARQEYLLALEAAYRNRALLRAPDSSQQRDFLRAQ